MSTPRSPPSSRRGSTSRCRSTARPLAEVIARLRDDVLPDCNRLYHPRYAGHQVSAPLPAAIWTESLIGGAQSVARGGGDVAHRRRRSSIASCAGCASSSGYGAGAGRHAHERRHRGDVHRAARRARRRRSPTCGRTASAPSRRWSSAASTRTTPWRAPSGELGLGMRNVVVVPSRDWRMDTDALAQTLDRLRARGAARDGRRRHGGLDRHRLVRRPRGDRRAVRGARHLAARRRRARRVGAAERAASRIACAGIDRARSIAWDPHKMMLLPLSAGVVLVRDERDLETRVLAARAVPLSRRRGRARVGPGAAQLPVLAPRRRRSSCGSRFQRYGARRHSARSTTGCATSTRAMHEQLAAHPSFEVLHEPECNILCFRWIGDGTLDDDDARRAQPRAARALQPVGRRLDHGDQPRRPARAARDDHESAHHDGRRRRHRGRDGGAGAAVVRRRGVAGRANRAAANMDSTCGEVFPSLNSRDHARQHHSRDDRQHAARPHQPALRASRAAKSGSSSSAPIRAAASRTASGSR